MWGVLPRLFIETLSSVEFLLQHFALGSAPTPPPHSNGLGVAHVFRLSAFVTPLHCLAVESVTDSIHVHSFATAGVDLCRITFETDRRRFVIQIVVTTYSHKQAGKHVVDTLPLQSSEKTA